MIYQDIRNRMDDGELILLDGGIGTELQKRGVAMNPGAWCGPVSLENRSVLEEIHIDYILAGAEIITANTYASSRVMLREAGFEDRFVEINTIAVEAALTARERSRQKEVLVAGSLSHMMPIKPGTNTTTDNTKGGWPSTEFMGEAFEELAELLRDCDCDLILLEMMYSPERILASLQAALKTGLPLWAGYSLRQDDRGKLVSYDEQNYSVEEVFRSISPESVDVMGLMHTGAHLVGPGLELLRRYWSGPLLAYPDSGFFKMPDWKFENVMTPAEFLDFSKAWFESGVRILGGCCGLGPEHIAVLQELKA